MATATTSEQKIGSVRVPLAAIRVDHADGQRQLDPDHVDRLRLSIEKVGVLVPLVVRANAGDDLNTPYDLVAGFHRYAAAAKVAEADSAGGTHYVPVVLRGHDDDSGGSTPAIDRAVENLARSELWPLEEAEAIAAAIDSGLTRKGAAETLGVSEQLVAQRLKLMDLPPAARAPWGPNPAGVYPPMQAIGILLGIADKSPELCADVVARTHPDHWHDLTRNPTWWVGKLISPDKDDLSPEAQLADLRDEIAQCESGGEDADILDELRADVAELEAKIANQPERVDTGMSWAEDLGRINQYTVERDDKDGDTVELREQLIAYEGLSRKVFGGYSASSVEFDEQSIDALRAAGVIIELGDQPTQMLCVDRELWIQQALDSVGRATERLGEKAQEVAREKREQKKAQEDGGVELTPEQQADQEKDRQLRALQREWTSADGPARAANHELWAKLYADGVTDGQVTMDAMKLLVWHVLGHGQEFSEGRMSPYHGKTMLGELAHNLKHVHPELTTVEPGPPLKSGKPGRANIVEATDEEAYKTLRKFLDGAKTPGELLDRTLTLLVADRYMVRHAISGGAGGRPFPVMGEWSTSAKLLTKLAKGKVPAAVTRLRKAIVKAYKDAGQDGVGGDGRI